MAIGLNHLHTNLAHLLVVCAAVNLALALLGGGRKASVAEWMARIHQYGIMMMGRLIYVAGLGLAMLVWAPASFFVMLWSLLYVARMPNGGVGRFRTGSDIAQGEDEVPSAYAAG